MASKRSTELASRAGLIYEQKLRRQLESTNPDDFVAIEPDPPDFFRQDIERGHPGRPHRTSRALPFALRVGHKSTVELGAAP